MSAIRLTPAAQGDLSAIWDYTHDRWGVQQAETYLTEIWAAIERVADDPSRGRSCGEIRQGYRRYSIGSHQIFYVDCAGEIDVIRILHQRMNPDRHV